MSQIDQSVNEQTTVNFVSNYSDWRKHNAVQKNFL